VPTTALQVPKQIKEVIGGKQKNKESSGMGHSMGRVHMQKQDLNTMNLMKFKVCDTVVLPPRSSPHGAASLARRIRKLVPALLPPNLNFVILTPRSRQGTKRKTSAVRRSGGAAAAVGSGGGGEAGANPFRNSLGIQFE
jgi:hypothetical protein